MDRDYDSARFNLAHALAATGDLNGAADEFNELLKRDPNDAGAQADLGTVYFKLHNYQDALVHLQASITLRSDDADVLTNYGTVLAIMGRFREAIKAFQQALTIDPNHEAARANLNQAKANLATGH